MIFLDSNVPIYAADNTDAAKHRKAREILAKAVGGGGFMISVQVLNEFANVALKKLKRTPAEVEGLVSVLRAVKIADLEAGLTVDALRIKDRTGLQFYDSLIIATARASGCSEVWSEDMSDGQEYDGVTVRNPFIKRKGLPI